MFPKVTPVPQPVTKPEAPALPTIAKAPVVHTEIVAALPPAEHTLMPPAQEILTPPAKLAPTPGTMVPAKPLPKNDAIAPAKPVPSAADLAAVSSLMSKGDAAMDGEDFVNAIAFYRQAINGVPLSIVPRLKLAQAYQKDGMSEKALDEAKRALVIDPSSQPLQELLTQLDQENGTSDGTLARFQATVAHDPNDPAAHAGLAEALWNSGDLNGAEAEYKAAKKLAPVGDHSADAHLAQLYAAQARYDDCLAALQSAGKDGYALALKIVKNRAETLSSTIDAARDAFAGGKSTREQFYDGAKKTSAQAQALAGFVAKVTPPAEYKLSHLHRMLSTNLLAQEAATLVASIESGESKQSDSVSQLEKSAQTEMLTAQAAEEKLGLWDGAK